MAKKNTAGSLRKGEIGGGGLLYNVIFRCCWVCEMDLVENCTLLCKTGYSSISPWLVHVAHLTGIYFQPSNWLLFWPPDWLLSLPPDWLLFHSSLDWLNLDLVFRKWTIRESHMVYRRTSTDKFLWQLLPGSPPPDWCGRKFLIFSLYSLSLSPWIFFSVREEPRLPLPALRHTWRMHTSMHTCANSHRNGWQKAMEDPEAKPVCLSPQVIKP